MKTINAWATHKLLDMTDKVKKFIDSHVEAVWNEPQPGRDSNSRVAAALNDNHVLHLVRVSNPLYFHYGVSLTPEWMLSWGYDESHDVGGFTIDKIDWRHTEEVPAIYTTRRDILLRMANVIAAFNHRVKYMLCECNCEHISRLITTGIAECTQFVTNDRNHAIERYMATSWGGYGWDDLA
jgi:hypothetical protein